jgi:ADP-ribose pyrophosphatase
MAKFERGILLEKEHLYRGRIVGLEVDTIQIHGVETLREVVRHPGGVVVLAEVDGDSIPFVRQHRYPINKDLLELPAGKLDPGEEPEKSAARELEEETGFRANSLVHVSSFYSSPGFCDELLHLYYTNDLTPSSQNTEFDENLEVEFYSLKKAIRMIESGEILDSKTITALYWLAHRRHR